MNLEINEQRFELASRFARWFGHGLDLIVLVFPPFLIAGIFGGKLGIPAFYPDSNLMLSLIVIWVILYFLFQDGINTGQSFGKRIMSMRVIDAQDGTPCPYWKSVVRNVFPFLLFFIGVLFTVVFESLMGDIAGIFMVGGLLVFHIDALMIFGDKRQRLGDKVAKTLVVKGNPPKDDVPAAPPKRVRTFFIGTGILVGCVVVTVYFLEGVPKSLESDDGLVEITVPWTWDELGPAERLSENTTLEVVGDFDDTVIMVITEPRKELNEVGMDLVSLSEIVTDGIIANLSEPVTVQEPNHITLDRLPAIQREFYGVIDNEIIMYLHTYVESEDYYHQIIGFSTDKEDKAKLQQIIESFRLR